MAVETEASPWVTENPRGLVDTVTAEALQRIDEDGSVLFHIDDDDFIMGPRDAIDVPNLPPVLRRDHLRFIANSIEGAVIDYARSHAQLPLDDLAYCLSPYREHRDFVWDGAGLVTVQPDGYPVGIDEDRLWVLGGRVE